MSTRRSDFDKLLQKVIDLISSLVAEVPESSEPKAENPLERSRQIIASASFRAAGTAGTLALPPGPLGWLTILPDLAIIWRIQAQMVADIAAAFGQKGNLTTETMLYCLFKQAAAAVFRDVVTRTGQRMLIRRPTLRAAQTLMERIGVKVTQRIAGRGLARLIPFLGALGMAGYAYYDTAQVGQTALDFFQSQIDDGR
jgi:hypothetical protein